MEGDTELGWSIELYHAHFHRQLLLRYGIVLEFGEFPTIARAISRGYARIVKTSDVGTIFAVKLPGRCDWIFIGTKLDRDYRVIATALPPSSYTETSDGRFIRHDGRAGGQWINSSHWKAKRAARHHP
jgi:hypothetical protein